MLLPGVECDLQPAVTSSVAVPSRDRRKSPKVWLAGELIVRAERQGLQHLPRKLFLKTTLRQLVLTGNELTCLPEDVRLLQQLRELHLSRNRLQHLPGGVSELQLLEVLDVSNNQLQDLPPGLCRLVHLNLLNLDGNPLSSSYYDGGPLLCDIWASAATATAAGGVGSRLQHPARLSAQTQAVLSHLLGKQDAATVQQVQQARLELLHNASRQQLDKLLHVADMESLQMCSRIAASLGQEVQQQVQQAQAAVAAMQAAADKAQQQRHTQRGCSPRSGRTAQDDAALEELRGAIKHFEQLCKPGRPSGSAYASAHTLWWQLQRQQLERGWRCSSPQLLAPAPGGDQAADAAAEPAVPEEGAAGGGKPVKHHFMTMQERTRQQLQSEGAASYKTWVKHKQQQQHLEQQHVQESKQQEAKQRRQRVVDRAARAVTLCDREMAWPSHLGLEAFAPGTFRIPPGQLKAIRRAYQKPHLACNSD